jgi:glycosyltransferase involved in cell wall biosynthesis
MYPDKKMIPLPAEIPYCKSTKETTRKYLKLNNDKKYIFWGTTQPQTQRKGKNLFDKCLDLLWDNLSEEEKNKIVILNAGPNAGKFGNSSNFKTISYGYQKTRKDMSILYKASDVSVCTTIADAGPMMISESMCNETPVIAFDRSIACDLCKDSETGYLIENLDLDKMSLSIKKILFEDDLTSMSDKSRKKYLTFHSDSAIMDKWKELFDNLMEK